MSFVKIYYDICKEIEIYEWRLQDLEQELRAARKVVFSGRMPSDGHAVHVPLDKALEKYDNVVEQIREVSERLAEKRAIRKQIEMSIRGFQGLAYQVAYLRDIENMTLKEIARKLGYSYDHIKRISSQIKKFRVSQDATFMPPTQ